MKKNLIRDNQRNLRANAPQNKAAHSQSPNHKKLVKRIELTQRDVPNQYDRSLQENIIFAKPQEEVVDFRVEIDRRFHKAVANKTFQFPLKQTEDDSSSSNNSSFESLRYVTVYDLASQNKKKPRAVKPLLKTVNDYLVDSKIDDSPGQDHITQPEQEGERSGELKKNDQAMPIEIAIQDKRSSAYKNLMSILEKHLNKDPLATQAPEPEPEKLTILKTLEDTNKKAVSTDILTKPESSEEKKEKRMSANLYIKKANLMRDPSQKSFGNYSIKSREGDGRASERIETGISFQEGIEKIKSKIKALELSQRAKANLSKDKTNFFTEGISGNSLNFESRISPNPRKLETLGKGLMQDSKQKMSHITNSNSVLKTLTPKYLTTKNTLSWRELADSKLSKYPSQEDSTLPINSVSNSLYQKVQGDVVSGRLSGAQKIHKIRLNTDNSDSSRDKNDDYIRSISTKASNFEDFYGSPTFQTIRNSKGNGQGIHHSIYQSLTKGREIRRLNTDVANQSSERQSSYLPGEYSARTAQSKINFKLDFSAKLKKHRDLVLTNRGNVSKEKSADILSIESILKSSNDVQNFNGGLNQSNKQSGISQRKYVK